MTGLVQQASAASMAPEEHDIEAWMEQVIRRELGSTLYGIDRTSEHRYRCNNELREALLQELSFKSFSEDLAARGLAQLSALAPSNADFQYLLTHTLDESRHANNFAEHFYKVYGARDEAALVAASETHVEQILRPLESYYYDFVLSRNDYYSGVAIIAIVLEGVLAPSSELSELKWAPFDDHAAQVQRSANVDEVRHLCVCAEIVKRGIDADAATRRRVVECIQAGFALWEQLPVYDMLLARENLYQEGMLAQPERVAEYELEPGLRLLDTDQNARIALASQWSQQMQAERLTYLGILPDVMNEVAEHAVS